MNYRLQQFLSAENITQAQFADSIGVARASVSHIIAGRNKPGFDFIQNMSRHVPDLNLEWLINGKGRMYKEGRQKDAQEMQPSEGQLFSSPEPSIPEAPAPIPEPVPVLQEPLPQNQSLPEKITSMEKMIDKQQSKVILQSTGRNITRIVVFYDDGTYQELREV